MNNPYMWTPPYCLDRVGFNSPPRPNWSPLPAPVPHMATPRGPHFLSMYQSYPNNFCRPPPPPMVNPQSPARFAQFPPNRNSFSNKNQQNNANQSSHSLQYGSFQFSNHKQIPYQTDKKLGNQNRHLNESSKSQNERNIKKKKNKPNKRDLPENCAFYCDVCDRGFKTEEKLEEHTDGHEKCKEEGCSYIAAPKLVQLHVRNHHYTGLAKKIWNVESQEDIAKWITERKKNFPTAANIEKKKALEAEKKARGEVLNEKQFYHRPNDQRQKRKGHYGPWGKKRKFNDCFAEDLPPEKKITEKEKDEVNNKKICDKREIDESTESSDPLSTILNTDLVNLSNNADSKEENKSTSKSLSLPSSLKALQTIYKSDEDDVNDVNANENSAQSTESQCNMTVLRERKNSCNRRQRSENQVRHEGTQELAKRPWHSKVFKRDRPTFLEKLLAKEIRHERNVILQCIHYIVKNNFFDKPNSVCPDQ